MIFNEINNIHILGKKEKDSNSAYRDLRWLSSPSSGPSTPSNQRPFRSLQAELFETLKYNKISIYLMSKKKEFSWWLNSGQNFHNATSLFSKNDIKLKKKNCLKHLRQPCHIKQTKKKKIQTYSICTLPSTQWTPNHIHGLVSLGSQFAKALFGSLFTLSRNLNKANPTFLDSKEQCNKNQSVLILKQQKTFRKQDQPWQKVTYLQG